MGIVPFPGVCRSYSPQNAAPYFFLLHGVDDDDFRDYNGLKCICIVVIRNNDHDDFPFSKM